MGPGGAPVGHGPRASNNMFRGTCLKKVKKPCCRGFEWVKRAPLGHLVGPWGARWVPVGPGGPGGMFIDTTSKTWAKTFHCTITDPAAADPGIL